MAVQRNQQQQAQGPALVSFKLGTFTGGMMPDGDYVLAKHEVVLWDYDGKITGNVLAVKVTALPYANGKGDESNPVIQHYSAGDAAAFGPNEAGTGFVALGTRTGLGKGSNFHIFLENLVNCGFPEDKFDNDLSVFDGTICHVTNIPAPTRNLPQSNLVQGPNQQQQRDRTIPVPSSMIKLPWDKKPMTAGARPAAAAVPAAAAAQRQAPAPAPASNNGGGAGDTLLAILPDVLANGTSFQRAQVRVGFFKACNAAGIPVSDRDAAMKVFNDDNELGNILAGVANGFVLEGAEIKALG